MDWTQPFNLRALDDEPRAVLLLHGFTGSPYEVHLLGKYLHEKHGLHCAAPLLAGHHASLAALSRTRWHDWLSSADAALHKLWRQVAATATAPRLSVVGLSMGGLLALELCRRYPASSSRTGPAQPAITAFAAMAVPLWLPAPYMRGIRRLCTVPGIRRLAIPKLFGSDLRERNLPRPPLRPRAMPLKCLASLLDLMDETARHLGEVRQPGLLCHGMSDHTAPYAAMAAIAAGLGTPKESLRCVALPQSYHLLPLDVEREFLFDEIAAHLERCL